MLEFESVCYSPHDNGGGDRSANRPIDLGAIITPLTAAQTILDICDRYGITPADVSAFANRGGNPAFTINVQDIVDEMMNS